MQILNYKYGILHLKKKFESKSFESYFQHIKSGDWNLTVRETEM